MNLETQFQAWRDGMRQAGIGPGPIRDELECHLRDSFEAQVRAGMDSETAFAAAAEKLGPPKALRQEYDVAVPRWTRVKRILGRRVELFPTDMRICAWAAFPAGIFGIYFSILNAYVNRIFFARETLAAGHYATAITLGVRFTSILLISMLSVQAAIRYLRQPAYAPARNLALFWVYSAWFIGVFLLETIDALSRGSFSNGRLLANSLSMWPLVLTIAVALVSYHDWTKRLRGGLPKSAS